MVLVMLAGCLSGILTARSARAEEPAVVRELVPEAAEGTLGYTASGYTSRETDYSKSFDGSYQTIFDGEKASGYVTADFGGTYCMDSVKVYPRVNSTVGNMNRVDGLTFYGSVNGIDYKKRI